MYKTIQESSRLVTNQNFLSVRCDRDELVTSWFRFSNSNNSDVMMLTYCPPLARCQTMSPGWMNGSHPKGNDTASIDDYAISKYMTTLIVIN